MGSLRGPRANKQEAGGWDGMAGRSAGARGAPGACEAPKVQLATSFCRNAQCDGIERFRILRE